MTDNTDDTNIDSAPLDKLGDDDGQTTASDEMYEGLDQPFSDEEPSDGGNIDLEPDVPNDNPLLLTETDTERTSQGDLLDESIPQEVSDEYLDSDWGGEVPNEHYVPEAEPDHATMFDEELEANEDELEQDSGYIDDAESLEDEEFDESYSVIIEDDGLTDLSEQVVEQHNRPDMDDESGDDGFLGSNIFRGKSLPFGLNKAQAGIWGAAILLLPFLLWGAIGDAKNSFSISQKEQSTHQPILNNPPRSAPAALPTAATTPSNTSANEVSYDVGGQLPPPGSTSRDVYNTLQRTLSEDAQRYKKLLNRVTTLEKGLISSINESAELKNQLSLLDSEVISLKRELLNAKTQLTNNANNGGAQNTQTISQNAYVRAFQRGITTPDRSRIIKPVDISSTSKKKKTKKQTQLPSTILKNTYVVTSTNTKAIVLDMSCRRVTVSIGSNISGAGKVVAINDGVVQTDKGIIEPGNERLCQ